MAESGDTRAFSQEFVAGDFVAAKDMVLKCPALARGSSGSAFLR